jgi:hypothetical protein
MPIQGRSSRSRGRGSGAIRSYAPDLRRDPLPGNAATPVLYSFAKGDRTVPNAATSAILRAGGLADRATLFRFDLADAQNLRSGRTRTGSWSTLAAGESDRPSRVRSRSRPSRLGRQSDVPTRTGRAALRVADRGATARGDLLHPLPAALHLTRWRGVGTSLARHSRHSPNRQAWQEWQGWAFVRVRWRSLVQTKTLQTARIERTGANGREHRALCHAEGRAFESHHPFLNHLQTGRYCRLGSKHETLVARLRVHLLPSATI